MKNLKKYYPSILVKPTFMLIAMSVSLLFLVQCTGSNVGDFGLQGDIKEHFRDMNYGITIFDNNVSSENKVNVDYQRGSGIYTDAEGKEMSYKWAFLIGENGDLLEGYIGTSLMDSTGVVELTRDETRDALRRCSSNDDHDERFACFDRVVHATINDCQSSLSISDCHEQCWYDLSQCVANP